MLGKDENIPLLSIEKQELKLDDDLFVSCQKGNFAKVVEYIESKTCSVDDLDSQKCSALHWAAINNHLNIAQFLIDRGATVDIIGGDLNATPLHWAARTGCIQMVTLLISKGADPNRFDSQGYNCIHLAAHSGQTFMIVYLIAIGMDLDSRDSMMRTPLMWTAYQGNSLNGMLELIKSGASLDATDQTGYTALHWAVISGHFEFASLLIKEGATIDIKDPKGKTPQDWAEERGHLIHWQSILADLGKKYSKRPNRPFPKRTTDNILYAIPFFLLPICFYLLGTLPIYYSIIAVLVTVAIVQNFFVVKYLLGGDPEELITTPLTSALCQASFFYCLIAWLKIVPFTGGLYFYHFFYMLFFSVSAYSLYLGYVTDPGFLRQCFDKKEKSETVIYLASHGLLDARNYCVTCCIRKPLRSKHCRTCDRCVAKFDHHCPWTHNCIGALNHQPFMVFIIGITLGIFCFDVLAFSYLSSLDLESIVPEPTCIFGDSWCSYLQADFFVWINAFWLSLQAIWVTFLVVSQFIQIMLQRTTNEALNYERFDYLVHPADLNLPFYQRRLLNPFDLGPIQNCVDFWSSKGPLSHVSWFSTYEIPPDLKARALDRFEKNKDV